MKKYYQHNHIALNLNGKRINKAGIPFTNLDNGENTAFKLKYKTNSYSGKLEIDEHGQKTLELHIENSLISDKDDFQNDLKNALIIARQYAQEADLDLITSTNLTYTKNPIINSIKIDNSHKNITPMLYSELYQLADNNIPLTITPSLKANDFHEYTLPEHLKTHIIRNKKDVSGIYVNVRENNKRSYDFRNIHIENKRCDDVIIHLNIAEEDISSLDELIVSHQNFKPPSSSCRSNSSGRNYFIISNDLGIISPEKADKFYERNPLAVIDIDHCDKMLNDGISDLYKKNEELAKEIIKRTHHIYNKNQENDLFLKDQASEARKEFIDISEWLQRKDKNELTF